MVTSRAFRFGWTAAQTRGGACGIEFCSIPVAAALPRPLSDPHRRVIFRNSPPTDGLLDATKRPAQLSECDHLLVFGVAQVIGHADAAYMVRRSHPIAIYRRPVLR